MCRSVASVASARRKRDRHTVSDQKAGLLPVLDRPEVPLHNNALESDVREFVQTPQAERGTGSDPGRRCRDTLARRSG